MPQSPEKTNNTNYQESYDPTTKKYDSTTEKYYPTTEKYNSTTTSETEVPPNKSIQNTPSMQLIFPQFPSGYFIPENLWNWLWKKFHDDEVSFLLFKKSFYSFCKKLYYFFKNQL